VTSATLLYDADCGFCRWSAAWILRWDRRRRLRAVALQDPEADRLLSGMAPERRAASWHLVAGERVVSAGAAVAHLARLLPGGVAIAALAEAMPGPTDRAYRWVAAHRDGLGRALGRRACAVAPGPGGGSEWRSERASAPREAPSAH
jgi:predicted DCC family thiol-disulfide oxidoreductase YuxK